MHKEKSIIPILFLSIILSIVFLSSNLLFAQETFLALCYHDVRDDVVAHYDQDETAVSTQNLIAHFAWLKAHGYKPVSINDLLAVQKGEKMLPEKAVLITFDDGLLSIYNRVYPILKMFNYPAVVALVPSWIESDKKRLIQYGQDTFDSEDFLTWKQIKELDQTGLIEFASHSNDLHHGILANPTGNKMPAATSRIYDPKTGQYETDEAYQKRIRDDLALSIETIQKHLGKKPRIMIWPYGKYNDITLSIARDLGMDITCTIDSDISTASNLKMINRLLISSNASVDQLDWQLKHPLPIDPENDPVRMIRIKLDDLYAPSQFQRDRNLDTLLERIKTMRISVVYLQAFSDFNEDGLADALYFPNRHLPVRVDLFNRVAWQIKTRAGTKVFAWMPVNAFDFSRRTSRAERFEVETSTSIYAPETRQLVLDIYEDLGKHADFDGVFFDVDTGLDKLSNYNLYNLKHYEEQWGLPPDMGVIQSNPELSNRLAVKNTEYLVLFTRELKKKLEINRAKMVTAGYTYAKHLMSDSDSNRVDQLYPFFRENYNYTVIRMMDEKGKGAVSKKFLHELVRKARLMDPRLRSTVFEIQTRDWPSGKKLKSSTILKLMETLELDGALSLGYSPDLFLEDFPGIKKIFTGISLQNFPYRKK